MRWEFIDTGFSPGSCNMRFDEMLASRTLGRSGSAVLRVYGWNPPAISIGAHQSESDFDAAALLRQGIDLVRRPTGGRAIFHAHEVTYCVVMPSEVYGPRETYRFISRGILRGLSFLGIEASLAAGDRGLRPRPGDPSSVPCFSGTARDEIQFDGRKLAGSAQRRYGSVVLQHGSILLGPQHRRIAEFLSGPAAAPHSAVEDELLERTTDIETILGRSVSFAECSQALKAGFEAACGVTFGDYEAKAPSIPTLHPQELP